MTNKARSHKSSNSGSFYSGGFNLWKVRFRWLGYALLAAFCVIQLSMPSRHASTQTRPENLQGISVEPSDRQAESKSYGSLDEAFAAASDTKSPKRPGSVTVLTGDGASNVDDKFGSSIAIYGDTAIVGAYYDNVGGISVGSAYIFVNDGTGWTLQQKLSGTSQGANFGSSVAISTDTVVIGANGVQPHGAAYVYVRTGTVWALQQELTSGSGDPNFYGGAVAIDGNTILVGDAGDGSVGLFSGSAYVFTRSGATWSLQQKLTATDGEANAFFGASVAVDGDQAVVGAPYAGAGAAYVFGRTGAIWAEQQKLTAVDGASGDQFGGSVAIEDITIGVGSEENQGRGAAYVFTKPKTTWSQEQKLTLPNGEEGDRFGETVGLFENTLAVTAPYDESTATFGAVYLYQLCDVPGSPPTKLTSPDPSEDPLFGVGVAISGGSVMVGSQAPDVQGNVYAFSRAGLSGPLGMAQCESTLTVNQTTDEEDADIEDDKCDFDPNQSGDQCTLRAAIQTANHIAGPDTIKFNISGGGIQTISPATSLPDITGPVTIDGTTQPGYSDKPLIQINGSGSGSTGLILTGNGNTIRALAVNRFGTGIRILGNNNTLSGIFAGIDADGTTVPPIGMRQVNGIEIHGQNNVVIGERNATTGATNSNITGNDLHGVYIVGTAATGNRVYGVDLGFAGGTVLESNLFTQQISVEGGSNNTIGGTTPAEANLIAGGGGGGIGLNDGAGGNFVKGNAITASNIAVFIGENANDNQIGGTVDAGERNYITDSDVGIQAGFLDGNRAPANGTKIYGNMIGINTANVFAGNDVGVLVGLATNTDIGSGSFGQHNFISGSILEGIQLTRLAGLTKVQGNFIGTDITGTILNANRDGIQVAGSGHQILNNVISGNNSYGISVFRVDPNDPMPSGNLIDNNRIGVNGSGTSVIPNDESGLLLDGTGNTVSNNVISGNTRYGIDVRGDGNTISGNKIGTNSEGNSARGNGEGGIAVSSSSNTISDNAISGNVGAGIQIARDPDRTPAVYPMSNIVSNNFIGTNAAGDAKMPNTGPGIVIADGASQNMIGSGNVISGNDSGGINVQKGLQTGAIPPSNNIFTGNFIGTNPSASTSIGNTGHGIFIQDSQSADNLISENTIAGNTGKGIFILGVATNQPKGIRPELPNGEPTRILGNKIGVVIGSGGTIKVPNTLEGIHLENFGNTIIGAAGTADDVSTIIAGNGGSGIRLSGPASTGNTIESSFIGTDENGTDDLGNGGDGITIVDAPNNTIGDPIRTPIRRKRVRIVRNAGNGISIRSTNGGTAQNNRVLGNNIGVIKSISEEYRRMPNAGHGIEITVPGQMTRMLRNLEVYLEGNNLSANDGTGVRISGAAYAQLINNIIGTIPNHTTANHGNGSDGIQLDDGASDTIIGGPAPNSGNTISDNGGAGVRLTETAGNNNLIDPNSIYGNAESGIVIVGAGPNDPADADVGPNKLQNYPTFTVDISSGDVIVSYQVDSAPENSTYGASGIYVEFFESDGTGAGQHFLGNDHYLLTDYTNGTPGTRQLNLGNAAALGIIAGDSITATATDAEGNSSEFAPAVHIPTGPPVTISGRVLTPDGRGIRDATVIMFDSHNVQHRVRTNSFGSYRFDAVQSGQPYLLTASAKRYIFENQNIQPTGNLTNVDFTGIE